jgi:amidase
MNGEDLPVGTTPSGANALVRWQHSSGGPAYCLARLVVRPTPAPPVIVLTCSGVRALNDRRLARIFAATDLLATPTTPNPPHGHAGPGEVLSVALTWAFNLSGHPAVSVPAGLSAAGTPVGLQLVARHGDEAALLFVAEGT